MSGGARLGSDLCRLLVGQVRDYGIVALNPGGLVLSWNAGAERIQGYQEQEIIGSSFEVLYTAEDVDRGRPGRHLADALATGHLTYEGWQLRADGSRFWAHVVLTAIYDGNGVLQGFGKIFRDDTDSRRFQKELMRRALHDPLTGLPNRALLLDRLRKALARLERSGEAVAVFFVDLDEFKAINDTYGHQAGDAVLVAVAERLRAALRGQDTVARLSGDEFVALCEGLHIEPTAAEIAQRLAAALAAPVVIGTEHILVSASIGITLTTNPGHDLEALLREADTAMYHAKADRHSQHRIRFTHYDRAMQDRLPAGDSTQGARCWAADRHGQTATGGAGDSPKGGLA